MIYVITGTIYHLINEEINNIVNNSNNIVYFDMDECGIDQVIEEASYASLFDSNKYIVIKNCNLFYNKNGKGDDKDNSEEEEQLSVNDEKNIKKLLDYLSKPNEEVTMIFVLSKQMDNRKKITKIIQEKYKIIPIKEYKPYEFTDVIKKILLKSGYKATNEIVNLFSERCLNNYDLLCQEMDKVKLYFEDRELNINELDLVLSRNMEDDIFKFVNSVIRKDYKKMFKYYEELKAIKAEPVILESALASKYRLIYIVKKLCDDGYNLEEMMAQTHQKEYPIKMALEDGISYRYEELNKKIINLAKLDLQSKTGDIDKYHGLEMFILEVE